MTVDGDKVENTRQLIDTISAMPPGTEVVLGVMRNGKPKSLTVTLEEREDPSSSAEPAAGPGGEGDVFERVGVTVVELDSVVRQNFRIEEDIDGVVVTRVRPLSPAGEEGMTPGLVITEANGQPVTSPSELRAVVADVDESGYVRLYVYSPRADIYRFVILKLEE